MTGGRIIRGAAISVASLFLVSGVALASNGWGVGRPNPGGNSPWSGPATTTVVSGDHHQAAPSAVITQPSPYRNGHPDPTAHPTEHPHATAAPHTGTQGHQGSHDTHDGWGSGYHHGDDCR